jgi:hypothetical protein
MNFTVVKLASEHVPCSRASGRHYMTRARLATKLELFSDKCVLRARFPFRSRFILRNVIVQMNNRKNTKIQVHEH